MQEKMRMKGALAKSGLRKVEPLLLISTERKGSHIVLTKES